MPNIATVLRQEILRLSRKEGRAQFGSVKKVTAQHRRDIAALKRQIAILERGMKELLSRVARAQPAMPSTAPSGVKLRFVAKGLRSHRARLGLSAHDFGRLVGVSANSVYGWESGKTVPRRDQVARIAAVRSFGKREAAQRLEEATSKRRKRG